MEEAKVRPNDWDRFLMTLGKLTFAMGSLEMTLIAMHCRITGKSEVELDLDNAYKHRQALEKKVEALQWTAAEKTDFINRHGEVRSLAKRRNRFIHIAVGSVSDNSIPGIPAGSLIDLRSYGIGFTSWDGQSGNIGYVAKKIDLDEINKLIEDVRGAQLGFRPYMELIDKIEPPIREFPEPAARKLIAGVT